MHRSRNAGRTWRAVGVSILINVMTGRRQNPTTRSIAAAMLAGVGTTTSIRPGL